MFWSFRYTLWISNRSSTPRTKGVNSGYETRAVVGCTLLTTLCRRTPRAGITCKLPRPASRLPDIRWIVNPAPDPGTRYGCPYSSSTWRALRPGTARPTWWCGMETLLAIHSGELNYLVYFYVILFILPYYSSICPFTTCVQSCIYTIMLWPYDTCP